MDIPDHIIDDIYKQTPNSWEELAAAARGIRNKYAQDKENPIYKITNHVYLGANAIVRDKKQWGLFFSQYPYERVKTNIHWALQPGKIIAAFIEAAGQLIQNNCASDERSLVEIDDNNSTVQQLVAREARTILAEMRQKLIPTVPSEAAVLDAVHIVHGGQMFRSIADALRQSYHDALKPA